MRARLSIALLGIGITIGCSRRDSPGTPPVTDASAAVSDFVPLADEPRDAQAASPKEQLAEYRTKLADLVEKKKYTEVCTGAPWFNQAICLWVAARADDKAAPKPDGAVFSAFFAQEHWKHVRGRIIGDPKAPGDLEVSVIGYRNHCILETSETNFTSRGAFDMWVQEEAQTKEVETNSGESAHWVVLDEMELAKAFTDLGKSGPGIESTGIAIDAMKAIAKYETYAEQKGAIPPVPGAPPPAAAPAAAPTASAATRAPVVTPGSGTSTAKAAPPAPAKNPRARADCMTACVTKCADDAACERACAAKCPP